MQPLHDVRGLSSASKTTTATTTVHLACAPNYVLQYFAFKKEIHVVNSYFSPNSFVIAVEVPPSCFLYLIYNSEFEQGLLVK